MKNSFVGALIAVSVLLGISSPALAAPACGGATEGYLSGVQWIVESVANLVGIQPQAPPGGAGAGEAGGSSSSQGGQAAPAGGAPGNSGAPIDTGAGEAPISGAPGGGGEGGGGSFPAQAVSPGLPAFGGMGRVFHVLAAAPDGSAPAGGDPFLPDGDQNGPAAQEDEQACADILQPDQIVVRRGDDVTLHFVGVNGGGRTIAVEHYQDQAVKLLHGENQTLRFIADRAGVFPILCPGDPPAVKGKLIVQN